MKLIPLVWALILGAVGFVAGYFGPLIFSPEANQGPLLGIFITGPGGAFLGLVLGLIVSLARPTVAIRKCILGAACFLVAGVTLYWSLPEPKYLGRIIDAEIGSCAPTDTIVSAEIAEWEVNISKVTWASPRTGWREDMQEFARTDPGLVLEMRIIRERSIYENRKPWNRGSFKMGPWVSKGETKRFYARFAGRECSAYAGISRNVYFPSTEGVESSDWPSRAPLTLLGLQVLGPVPDRFRELVAD
ncbi:MAG TPA: hypothetical protein VGM62_11715 [Chthoniobacterales bacterium]|jgi:hypothetical protein